MEGVRYIATEAIIKDKAFEASLGGGGIGPTVELSHDTFDAYRKALYFGDPAQHLPHRKLDDYEREFFKAKRLQNGTASLVKCPMA